MKRRRRRRRRRNQESEIDCLQLIGRESFVRLGFERGFERGLMITFERGFGRGFERKFVVLGVLREGLLRRKGGFVRGFVEIKEEEEEEVLLIFVMKKKKGRLRAEEEGLLRYEKKKKKISWDGTRSAPVRLFKKKIKKVPIRLAQKASMKKSRLKLG